MLLIIHFSFTGQVPVVNHLTLAERQRFLPTLKTLISVLEKPQLDATEVNFLLEQARDLSKALNEAIPA